MFSFEPAARRAATASGTAVALTVAAGPGAPPPRVTPSAPGSLDALATACSVTRGCWCPSW